jgi:DNA processing protein
MMDNHDDPERLARAALTYLAEPADPKLAALVRAAGAPRAVEAIREGYIPPEAAPAAFGINGSSREAAARALLRWQARLGELPGSGELREFARGGIRLVCPGDPEWPTQLEDLREETPYALWLRGNGDLRFGCLRSVAVVGSRASTSYGNYVAAEISSSLASCGWTIVSGGAYGIDAAAHRGALGAGGPGGGGLSIAVLACGVDRPYPAGHTELMNSTAANGVVLSEWPPGRNVTRLRFLKRNRVMAALTRGTLVVEAGRRSGALNTGKHAKELGRPLMVVPGLVTSATSAGCHMMIREWEATLVTSAAEVAELLGPLSVSSSQPSEPVLPWDALDPDQQAVLDALLPRRGLSTREIAIRSGLDPDTVFGCLGALAAGGFAERCAQGWWTRVRKPTET